MNDLEFKHCSVKKSHIINIHECDDVVQQRISYAAQNNEDEINEPCCIHFNEKYFNKLLRKSNIKPSTKNILLSKGFYDETTDCIEFHMDDSDFFLELSNDLPLRDMKSIRRNTMAKTRIVFGQDESMHFPRSLKKFYWTVEGHIPIRSMTKGI